MFPCPLGKGWGKAAVRGLVRASTHQNAFAEVSDGRNVVAQDNLSALNRIAPHLAMAITYVSNGRRRGRVSGEGGESRLGLGLTGEVLSRITKSCPFGNLFSRMHRVVVCDKSWAAPSRPRGWWLNI